MIEEIIYILCSLTSIACTILLFRGYLRNKSQLLLWSSLCFAGLSVNNILVFVDTVLITSIDLTLYRGLSAAIAMAVLVYGLIMETT